MIPRYAYSLHERAARAIIAADDSETAELLGLFEALAREPGRRGTENVIDESGRTNEVIYSANFRVVYWPDHAIKEVRIMDVRRY
jgi:hypothetical protein